MGKLILTADDYGLDEGVNEGTLISVRNNTVTSVQVMANMATPQQIQNLATAIRESGNLCGIGLHICTTFGPSLMQKPTSFTEKWADGRYYFIDVRDWKYTPDSDDDMKEELEAQFNRLKTTIGGAGYIDSISSHQNLHFFNEDYLKMLVDLADENDVPFRSPLRWDQDKGTKLYPDAAGPKPIERTAIRTLLGCDHHSTRQILWDGASKSAMRQRLDYIAQNGTGGAPNSLCGPWYGQPDKRAIEWLIDQMDEMAAERPDYSTEILMHLSSTGQGDSGKENYKMSKRKNEYTKLNSPIVKGLINSLYTKPNLTLGSYRKVLRGQDVSY
jgi:predicted glycoside hydrolase/deacetylase ChbG (UPF0249 family)